jgi:hypothetical protein
VINNWTEYLAGGQCLNRAFGQFEEARQMGRQLFAHKRYILRAGCSILVRIVLDILTYARTYIRRSQMSGHITTLILVNFQQRNTFEWFIDNLNDEMGFVYKVSILFRMYLSKYGQLQYLHLRSIILGWGKSSLTPAENSKFIHKFY